MATAVTQGATGTPNIDGLLSGVKWGGGFTFSFPTATSQYPVGYGPETGAGFAAVSSQEQAAVKAIMLGTAGTNVVKATSLASFILTGVSQASGGAGDIRIAQSPAANPTAYAYYPSNVATGQGGDVWFGTAYAGTTNDFRNPVAGNYAYLTHIHEIGHALGLKHSHEAGGPGNIAVPSNRDALEFTVMSYRTYVGQSTSGGYTFGPFDAPQTFMMLDILALQTMYGADYGAQSNNTNSVYTWNPSTGEMSINGVLQGRPGANKVFMTTWDGGGVDTYSFTNYTTGLMVDLRPGNWSTISSAQKANLGNGKVASGNVYNALLFNDDLRSIIENANGGSGSDYITGNQVANVLNGNAGNDTLRGLAGNDRLTGGAGADRLEGGTENDVYFTDGLDTLVESAGAGTDKVYSTATHTLGTNFENLQLDGTANINGTGNAAANVVNGNEQKNTLSGLGGNDLLQGRGGNDILIGGAGTDTMVGGTGADYFDFNSLSESAVGPTRDVISDFSRAQGDKIDLSTIDAISSITGNQAFTFITGPVFTGEGQVRFDAGIIYINKDADVNTIEAEIAVTGITTMNAGDFIL